MDEWRSGRMGWVDVDGWGCGVDHHLAVIQALPQPELRRPDVLTGL